MVGRERSDKVRRGAKIIDMFCDTKCDDIIHFTQLKLSKDSDKYYRLNKSQLKYKNNPDGNLTIDKWVPRHEGYLTTGDNRMTNGCTIDQLRATSSTADDSYIQSRGLKDEFGNPVTAVRDTWVVGVASSEIPWVGAIKLFFSGTSSFVSGQTWNNLFTLIAAVVIIPMVYDIFIPSKNEEEE